MTTFADWLFQVALQLDTNGYYGVATGGSTSTLVDTNHTFDAEEYADGTLFIRSGDLASKAIKVISSLENTLTFGTQSKAVVASIVYFLASNKYTLRDLLRFGNLALTEHKIKKADTSLTVTASTRAYTLPSGVRGIKRVEIATSLSEPYDYYVHQNWQEVDGVLEFDANTEPQNAGYTIRLIYYGTVGPYAETDTVDDQVNLDWFKWKTISLIYRDEYARRGDDDKRYVELYNEANSKLEGIERDMRTMNRDVRLAVW